MDKPGKFFKTKFPNNFVVMCTAKRDDGSCGGYTLQNKTELAKCKVCDHAIYEGIVVFGVGEPSYGVKLLSQGRFCLGSDLVFEEIEISSIKPEDFAEVKPSILILSAIDDPSLKNDEHKVIYTHADGIRHECPLLTKGMARALALGLALTDGLDEIYTCTNGTYTSELVSIKSLKGLGNENKEKSKEAITT